MKFTKWCKSWFIGHPVGWDWQARINIAKDGWNFSSGDINRAGRYTSCAIGERVYRIKGDIGSSDPDDICNVFINSDFAGRLAFDFYRAVSRQEISEAQNIYNQIQRLELK